MHGWPDIEANLEHQGTRGKKCENWFAWFGRMSDFLLLVQEAVDVTDYFGLQTFLLPKGPTQQTAIIESMKYCMDFELCYARVLIGRRVSSRVLIFYTRAEL